MVKHLSIVRSDYDVLSVLALSSRFDGQLYQLQNLEELRLFQYSLCRVVLMVGIENCSGIENTKLSVLALSSRFDGPRPAAGRPDTFVDFQYSLCRVVLMVSNWRT